MNPAQRKADAARATKPSTKPEVCVWIASYKGRKARITSNMSTRQYPSWIIEHGEHVRWKVISGREFMFAPKSTPGGGKHE